MEEKILNEILKDTFTLDSLRKRVQLLKLILQTNIYKPNSSKDESSAQLEAGEKAWLSGFDKQLITGISSQMYTSLSP